MSHRPWTDAKRLRELYWEKDMSQPEIAEKLGCSPNTVCRWMQKLDIETRDPASVGAERGGKTDGREDCPWRDEQRLREKYEEKGMRKIADDWNTSRETVRRWIRNFGIETRDGDEYHGGGLPSDCLTKRERMSRYEQFYGGPEGKVYLHRLLAVAEFGFDEVCGKLVHHQNGIAWDNRPSNIELVTRAEHLGRHTAQAHQ